MYFVAKWKCIWGCLFGNKQNDIALWFFKNKIFKLLMYYCFDNLRNCAKISHPRLKIWFATYWIYSCNSTIIYYKITRTHRLRHIPPRTKKIPLNIFSFVFSLFSSVFQLSWFEVLSGAAVLPVTVTGPNYHVQTSTQHSDKTDTLNLPQRSLNQENELTCNLIFQPIKLSSTCPLSRHEKTP